jgi:hypothetical protein
LPEVSLTAGIERSVPEDHTSDAIARPDLRAAGRVGGHVEIASIRMVSVLFDVGTSDNFSVENYHTEWMAGLESLDERRIVTRVSFRLADHHDGAAADDESVDDQPLHGFADFELEYTIPLGKNFSQADVEAFADVNAVMNAWPYWRQLVQTTIAAMALPPIPVPVFRVPVSSLTDQPVQDAQKPKAPVKKSSTAGRTPPGKAAGSGKRAAG